MGTLYAQADKWEDSGAQLCSKKWGVPIFGGVEGVGSGVPLPRNFSLLTLEKAHFGGYLMHSDVLILKLWFAVHRMLEGSATDSVSFSLTGQFFSVRAISWGGLAPLAPDKLRPSLPPRFLPPLPFLFHSFSFLAKLTRCSYVATCSL